MDHPYSTLKTLYLLVKDEAQPTGFACTPEQLAARQRLPRQVVGQHLASLAGEGLVACRQPDPSTVFLTEQGWEKVQSLDALTYL